MVGWWKKVWSVTGKRLEQYLLALRTIHEIVLRLWIMATKTCFQKNFKKHPSSKLCTCSLWIFTLHYLNKRKIHACLPAGEQCSTKCYYDMQVRASGFETLCRGDPELYVVGTVCCVSWGFRAAAQASQIRRGGSVSCKEFLSTVRAVFEAQIKWSKSTRSEINLRPGRERRMKKDKFERKRLCTTGESSQLPVKNGQFDSLLPMSAITMRISYHSWWIYNRMLLYYAGNLLIEWDLHAVLPVHEC